MKAVTSVRINVDIINHLRQMNISVSDYINLLIIEDLKKKSYEETYLKKVVEKAQNDEKKSSIIKEMKLIGAINNIPNRIKQISRDNEEVFYSILVKNLELLKIEYSCEYSQETKNIIKKAYKEVQQLYVDVFGDTIRFKKLKNEKKNKKIKSL